ncbi:MAG TPA: DUF1702 family protein [Thermoleophilaceae bacterium]
MRLRSRVLAIRPKDTKFATLGFPPGAPGPTAALEGHAASFAFGYNAALAAVDVADLAEPLGGTAPAERGFAYEGSGMALALLDLMTPGSSDRLGALLRGHGEPYVHTINAGAGWALARLRLRPRNRLPALDPFLRWLALDGYGFHEGLFRAPRFVSERATPRRLSGYERRAFDQGLGRSLWFVDCADPERIARTIGGFPTERRADLWSGIGVAATYSVAVEAGELERLWELAGDFRPDVRLGSALGAVIRHRAGNVVPHTHTATELFCGQTVDEVAEAAEQERAGLVADRTGESYELWRTRVRDRLGAGVPTSP